MLSRLFLAMLSFPVLLIASSHAQTDSSSNVQLERNSIIDPLFQETSHTDIGMIPCECDCCTQVAGDSFWHVDFDLTVLTARFMTTAFDLTGGARGVGPRLQIGREKDSGFGWRTRFWGINADSKIVDPNTGPTGAVLDVSASRFDVDFYRRFRADKGSLLFGAGITGASMELELSDPNSIDTGKDSGTGVSIFIEGRHLYRSTPKVEWFVIGRGRWAYLVADWESTLFPGVEGSGSLNVAEAAFGTEMVRRFRHGDFVLQYLMEAQSWETTFNGDLNFLGSSLRFGYYW